MIADVRESQMHQSICAYCKQPATFTKEPGSKRTPRSCNQRDSGVAKPVKLRIPDKIAAVRELTRMCG